MRAKNHHHLWTVVANHVPVAIVAAAKQEDAWKIVTALYERNDIKGEQAHASVKPCDGRQARRVIKQADTMGVGDRFLARLGGGVFMTNIGGLSIDKAAA